MGPRDGGLNKDWKLFFQKLNLVFLFVFFLIQFYVPIKVISAHMRRANQQVGENGETLEKPPGTPASRTWLVSHVASAGLEPAPDTVVR